MKRSKYLIMMSLAFFLFQPVCSVQAQAPSKTKQPQAPITYSGDTDKTILRRTQWIEGAKKEGAVFLWGIDLPNEVKKIIVEFNRVYPFIKVDYWRGQDTERSARLETEHSVGRLTVDIFKTGLPEFTHWRKIGVADKYTDFIPEIDKMDKRMYSKYGDWAQIGQNAVTPQYNSKLISDAEAPKSWEDLLNPKWKGKIGMARDPKAWFPLALAEGGWGVEKTEEFLKKLKEQQIIWASSNIAAQTLLISGEIKIISDTFIRRAFQAEEKGAPVKWVRVHPVPITGGSFLLVKNAPHPNAARLFLEWLYSPQGLVTYERITGYGIATPGSGTKLSKALEGLPLVFQTEEVSMKTAELHLVDRFARILGITPE